jgi:alkylation response protein AidB-like acyl-CoA dehydrogenase
MDFNQHFTLNPSGGDSDVTLAALATALECMSQPSPDDVFPEALINELRSLGVLAATLPGVEGGLGWGTDDTGASSLSKVLQLLGYRSLAVGRIYEAHVNAIALVFRYGDARIRALTSDAVKAGHLFGLWVAPAEQPVRARLSGSTLRITGRKAFCTAAGFATRAVITAQDDYGLERMIMIDTAATEVDPISTTNLLGMRNTSTKSVMFECTVPSEHCFGDAGDYLREPDLSVGAWRTSAVTVGGLRALVDETIGQLRSRHRHTNPHQIARIGQMLIRTHTATMWIGSVTERFMAERTDEHLIGHVHLCRIAVEQACLEVIPFVQRSLGLSSLSSGNPVERMMRDLATYLRQPAGDEILTQAAVTFAQLTRPTSLGALT